MKKKILMLFMALLSFVCLAACNGGESSSASSGASTSESVDVSEDSSTEETSIPDFPDNDFGKDNETTYPNAWN